MTLADAFAEWGREDARPEDPDRTPRRKPTHLKPVTRTSFDPEDRVLVVRIEFTEDDIGA